MDNFVTGSAVSASVVSASEDILADPDETMKVIAQMMYDTGLQEVLDDAQSQLDAYLESLK